MPKNRFRVKTPAGWLIVEEKGAENEYPGVLIGFSKDGKDYDAYSDTIACVEYDSTRGGRIMTSTYKRDREEPVNITDWNSKYDGEENNG